MNLLNHDASPFLKENASCNGQFFKPPIEPLKRQTKAEGWFVENDQCSFSCQTLRRLRGVIPTSGVVLIQNNVRPHNAVVTQQLLEQFKWDLSDHPAHSPDLAKRGFETTDMKNA
ncbi:hypothetical protein AVEN_34672-1 [Araneus ventricosus]|uniref:Tc1-like transposase DDE domain-containing protein n=1 Tax=Araneus ventricosus TaxID=182803 RepID=A0A4Y2B064_ARAVE|nr:hypothetical protein AVEN_34672-1 [Araneus ventricosus]